MDEMPPYALVWTEQFEADLNRIASRFNGGADGHEWFDAVGVAFYEDIQFKPLTNSHPLGSTGIRYIRTKDHFGDIPPMYVTFRITDEPPDGMIELRRAVTEDEVRDERLWPWIFGEAT